MWQTTFKVAPVTWMAFHGTHNHLSLIVIDVWKGLYWFADLIIFKKQKTIILTGI